MKELSLIQIQQVNGSFKFNIGQAIAASVIGFVTGGPAGLGIALSGVIMAHGVNSLDELYHEK